MPSPFWPASFSARAMKARDEEHARDKLIAEMVLAGWRFEQHVVRHSSDDVTMAYDTYSPDGAYHGQNPTRHGAASYAKWQMMQDDKSTPVGASNSGQRKLTLAAAIRHRQVRAMGPVDASTHSNTGQRKFTVGYGDTGWRPL